MYAAQHYTPGIVHRSSLHASKQSMVKRSCRVKWMVVDVPYSVKKDRTRRMKFEVGVLPHSRMKTTKQEHQVPENDFTKRSSADFERRGHKEISVSSEN
ncbi:hypothetical protein TNCV_3800751 [Trichonephila clavipes]|nr:hypothetical protein TNCV_3800751 [Trichonephila clavipes]